MAEIEGKSVLACRLLEEKYINRKSLDTGRQLQEPCLPTGHPVKQPEGTCGASLIGCF